MVTFWHVPQVNRILQKIAILTQRVLANNCEKYCNKINSCFQVSVVFVRTRFWPHNVANVNCRVTFHAHCLSIKLHGFQTSITGTRVPVVFCVLVIWLDPAHFYPKTRIRSKSIGLFCCSREKEPLGLERSEQFGHV